MRLDHIDYADVRVRAYDDHIRRHRDFPSRRLDLWADDNRYCAAVLVVHPWYGALDDEQLVDLLLDAARAVGARRGGPAGGADDDPAVRVPVPDHAVPAGPPADRQPADDHYLRIADRAADDRYGSRADDPDADDDPC